MVTAINSDCYLWLVFTGRAFFCVEFGSLPSSEYVCGFFKLYYYKFHLTVLKWSQSSWECPMVKRQSKMEEGIGVGTNFK